MSFSQWLPYLQNLWRKWGTRYPVYSIFSILSRWLAGPPLLSCQPRGARLPLPSSRSSSATTRLLQHCRLHLAARVQRVAIDLNVLQRREPRPTQGQPRLGFHLPLPFPGGDYGAVVGPPRCSPPPPRPPLRVHPSPTCEDRRRIVTVKRKAGFQPSFSQLDGEGEDSPPPACQYTRPAGPATWDHPVCNHCERCGKCPSLCIGHSGCDCDRYDFDCDVCHCSRYVRYSNPSWTSPAKDFSK